jgi:hypothetical protein
VTPIEADKQQVETAVPSREGTAPWIFDPPTGWPAPFDLIQGLLEGAWSWIVDSIDALWQNLVAWGESLWKSITDAFWSLWTSIVGAVDSLWRSILFGFDNLWATFWVHSLPSWDDIVRGLGDVWNGFVDALGRLWTGIVRAFDDLYHAVCDFLFGIADWIYARLLDVVGHWDPDKQRFVGGFLGWLWDGVAGIIGTVVNYFSGFGAWLTDCFDWLHSSVVGWLVGAMEVVGKGIGDGLQAAWKWFSEGAVAIFTGVTSFLNENVVKPIVGAMQWLFNMVSDAVLGLIDSVEQLFKGHSPITGEEALSIGVLAAAGAAMIGCSINAMIDVASIEVLGTGLDTPSIGRFVTELINPQMFMGAVLGVLVAEGVRTPVTHLYRKWFRPEIPAIREAQEMLWRGKLNMGQFRDVVAMQGLGGAYEEGFVELASQIPPAPDIVSMVVREAFVPEMVIEAPSIFMECMVKKGFAKEWSDRYWTAHFVPIALTQAYENLWRGFWTKDDFMRALHIADIHPMWREDIYKVAFKAPSARELGYGFDTNVYTIDDIIKYRRYAGLNEEDAGKAATAMVAYRTEAEREALRREALADYVAGLDNEADLRAKLAAIGGRPEIIDLWVSRAQYREGRDVKIDLVGIVKSEYLKGLLKDDELREELRSIGVKPERIELHLLEVQTKKKAAAKDDTAAKKKLLTEANISKAWELGLIPDQEFIRRLEERDYTPEDAQLLLEVQLTPKPVTPEEIERRKKAITARINSTRRRYERLITALDLRAGTVSSEISSLNIEMKEVFDVIDTEIRSLEEELRGITPEVAAKPILEAIANVKRRYDRMLARLDRQAAATTSEIPETVRIYAETLDVIDVTIIYVEEELAILGAVE